AGLLGRSFIKLLRTDPGFKTENALAMTLSLPSTVTPQEDERLRQFYSQLVERISQLPGVIAAGGINALPLADRGANGRFLIDDNPALRGEADYRVASGGYFPALGLRLLQGRLFDKTDTVNSPHAAVISQSLAARYWPKGDAIGQRIQFGNMDTDKRLLHVVGIVSDVRDQGLDTEAGPTVYAYSLQRPQWWQVSRLSIVVRSQSDPQTLIPQMREAVTALRSDVPLRFRTMERVFSSSLDQRRFSLVLYGVFAAVALVIAAIGIYGVISYGVAQRTQELGIRMALGAQSGDVLRLVAGQGMKPALIGVAAGVAGALALTGFIKSMLYGISATDPLTFVLIASLFLAIALLACWIPARRATKVDPMVALKCE
ncbi:MAG TPA: ABC transporter permease, partial [Blastocatellia bacterium]|nr:ABC transporter permease [Blastocatellia bacterium]